MPNAPRCAYGRRAGRLLACAILALSTLGCTSLDERLRGARASFAQGQYEAADAAFAALIEDDPSNQPVYELDRAMVQLALHNPDFAETLLTRSKNYLDDVSSNGVLGWLGAMLTDDTSLAYIGEDYEHILVRAVLAVTNLVGRGGDVDAYANQVVQKQQEIIESFDDEQLKDAAGQNPKTAYRLVGFGAYLRAILAERDPLSIDLARREFERVQKLEPNYRDIEDHLARVRDGQHSAKGNGVLHVLALVGRGPSKIEGSEPVSQLSTVLAQIIWARERGRATIPTITEVKVPILRPASGNPTAAEVRVNGEGVGTTAIVTDVTQTALQQFEILKPWIIARAVLRRAFKVAVIEGLKEATNPRDEHRKDDPKRRRKAAARNDGADLLLSVAGLLWTAIERADLRGWGLLPGSFQVLRVELPAGVHEITIHATDRSAATGAPQTVPVEVRDGRDSFVVVQVPTTAGGPPPLTSNPAPDAGVLP